MTSQEAAIRYAAKGLAVIPVHSITISGICSCGALDDYLGVHKHAMGKHPYTEHGHKDASKDLEQIQAWWRDYPNANVGIATGRISDIVVVDIDKKNDGLTSLKKLERRYGPMPVTPKVYSGGGGIHFYFKSPGFEVRGRRGMLPGVDVQADGGRINAPPSNHKLRTTYVWDDRMNLDSVPFALLPRWLLTMILTKKDKFEHILRMRVS